MVVDEVTFGGDIAAITSAMKEAVSQVEEHVHNVSAADDVGLTHRVNDVSLSILSLHHCHRLSSRNTCIVTFYCLNVIIKCNFKSLQLIKNYK